MRHSAVCCDNWCRSEGCEVAEKEFTKHFSGSWQRTSASQLGLPLPFFQAWMASIRAAPSTPAKRVLRVDEKVTCSGILIQRSDTINKNSIYPRLRITAALCMVAYGTAVVVQDEYLKCRKSPYCCPYKNFLLCCCIKYQRRIHSGADGGWPKEVHEK